MADPGDFRMFKYYAHMFCHCQTAGRVTDLVGNHFQLIPGAVGKFKYGVQETRAAGSVKPCQAADKGIRAETEDQLFA